MTWAFKRQLFYGAIVVLFFGVLAYLVVSPYVNKPATCTDGRQNGDETGIDCGGSCALACINQVDNISVLWAHSFQVIPGRYNAVAYLENHNKNTVVEKINYRFRFADANNLYIGKREGTTYVPPSGKFAVFEPAIGVGNSIPVYTTFEFTSAPEWIQVPAEKVNQLKENVSDIRLTNQDTTPTLSATITNNSLYIVPDINVIVILYDQKGNALSASKTYIDQLTSGEAKQITFTWPQPIVGNVVTKEIIPIFDIFSVKLK